MDHVFHYGPHVQHRSLVKQTRPSRGEAPDGCGIATKVARGFRGCLFVNARPRSTHEIETRRERGREGDVYYKPVMAQSYLPVIISHVDAPSFDSSFAHGEYFLFLRFRLEPHAEMGDNVLCNSTPVFALTKWRDNVSWYFRSVLEIMLRTRSCKKI